MDIAQSTERNNMMKLIVGVIVVPFFVLGILCAGPGIAFMAGWKLVSLGVRNKINKWEA